MANPYKEIDAYTPVMRGLNALGGTLGKLHDSIFLTPAGRKALAETRKMGAIKTPQQDSGPDFTGTPGPLETLINFSKGVQDPQLGSVGALMSMPEPTPSPALGGRSAPQPATNPTTAKSKIDPGMESLGQTAVNVGLPFAGTSIGTSKGGASVQLDGSKGLGDTSAISNRVDWSPGSANYQAARSEAADRLGMTSDGSGGYRPMNQSERDAAGLTTKQEYLTRNNQDISTQLGYIAANAGNMYDGDEKNRAAQMRIAALQGMNHQIQTGINGDQVLEAHKYTADADAGTRRATAQAAILGHQMDANSKIEAARLGAMGREAAARVAHAGDPQKDTKEMIKTYYDSIKNLNLPAGYEGQHMSLAKDLANAQDPNADFGIYYSPGSQRQGIATKRSVYEPLLAKYTKAGYPIKDAHASAVRDLLTLEQKTGTSLHKPFPNLDILRNRNAKPADPILGE